MSIGLTTWFLLKLVNDDYWVYQRQIALAALLTAFCSGLFWLFKKGNLQIFFEALKIRGGGDLYDSYGTGKFSIYVLFGCLLTATILQGIQFKASHSDTFRQLETHIRADQNVKEKIGPVKLIRFTGFLGFLQNPAYPERQGLYANVIVFGELGKMKLHTALERENDYWIIEYDVGGAL